MGSVLLRSRAGPYVDLEGFVPARSLPRASVGFQARVNPPGDSGRPGVAVEQPNRFRGQRGDAGTPGIARRVDPRLEAGGRARERSRWHEALEVHVRTGT